MRKYDLISGLFFLFLGAGTSLIAHRLKLGILSEPGAGLIPFGVAVLLGLMSIGLFLKSLLQKTGTAQRDGILKGIAWGRVASVLCALLGYGLGLNFLGFHICTFLVILVLLGISGHRKWWLTVAISIFTVLCTYVIFEAWLGCPFPKGYLGI